MSLGKFTRAASLSVLLAAAGCQEGGDGIVSLFPKADKPIPAELMKVMKTKAMATTAPVMVRIFKLENELEIWKETATGRYDQLAVYEICKWSGVLGPKIKEGDRQAPEGFYTVNPYQMNPNSDYHLSFNMGFPNAFDRAHERTGKHLMVHGACSSAGCYSMTDERIQDIYSIAREAFKGGQRNFQIQAFPFRMTPDNMARYRDNPNFEFWKMLKEGSDHFEITRIPPKIDVCDKRYVFNRVTEGEKDFKADEACPELTIPESLMLAYSEKVTKDTKAYEEAIKKLAFRDFLAGRHPAGQAADAAAAPVLEANADLADGEGSAGVMGAIPVPRPAPRVEAAPAPPPKKKWSLLALFGIKS